jgi:hypothetical protein
VAIRISLALKLFDYSRSDFPPEDRNEYMADKRLTTWMRLQPEGRIHTGGEVTAASDRSHCHGCVFGTCAGSGKDEEDAY